jgi:hypothetical protein
METIKRAIRTVRDFWLIIFVFVGGITLITLATGCAGEAMDAQNATESVNVADSVEQVTYYHHPAEEEVDLGTAMQKIQAIGFMGWRGEGTAMRGRLCADVIASENDQLCILPAQKANKFHIEPVGFTVNDYDQVVDGFLGTKAVWAFLGIEDIGWTWTQGTANDYNVRIMADNVNGSAYATDDVRRWVSIACEAMSPQLTEPTPLVGKWHRCSKITIRIDVADMFADGADASKRNPRLQQGGALGLVWGVGLGIGNINPGTITQRKSANGFLSQGVSSREYCALDTFALGSKVEIRKLDLNTVCD